MTRLLRENSIDGGESCAPVQNSLFQSLRRFLLLWCHVAGESSAAQNALNTELSEAKAASVADVFEQTWSTQPAICGQVLGIHANEQFLQLWLFDPPATQYLPRYFFFFANAFATHLVFWFFHL